MKHPSQEDLIRFLSGEVEEREAARFFSHFDRCDACHERVAVLRGLRSDFDAAWSRFLIEVEGRGGESVAESLGIMEIAVGGFLDDVRQWATAAVQAVRDAVDESRLTGTFLPAYAGVGDPDRIGISRITGEASDLWREGRKSECVEALRKASLLDPASVESATIRLVSGGVPIGEFVVSAVRRSVSVLIHSRRFTSLKGEVFLSYPGHATLSRQLLPVEGATYRLAEFENVPGGEFTIRLRFSGGAGR